MVDCWLQAVATSGARLPAITQSPQLPAQQPSSNGTIGAGTGAADLSNVRVDPLGRPTSIDKEHQVQQPTWRDMHSICNRLSHETLAIRCAVATIQDATVSNET